MIHLFSLLKLRSVRHFAHAGRSALAVGMLGVLLLGCQVPQPAPPVDVSAKNNALEADRREARRREEQARLARQREAARRAEQIRYLLAEAERALAADQLLYPPETSAFRYYRAVLLWDSSVAAAHRGMRRITERYFQLAEQAYRQGDRRKAAQMLNRAARVAATPQELAAYRDKFDAPARLPAADNEYLLPVSALRARNEKARQLLADVAERAREEDSRLLIVARNDAEGRWIYQKMRESVPGYRLRGNIRRGVKPRIVLIDISG